MLKLIDYLINYDIKRNKKLYSLKISANQELFVVTRYFEFKKKGTIRN